MTAQTLLKQIKQEEAATTVKIQKLFSVAMINKGLLAKVDKATNSSSASKTPPKEISKLFETELTTAKRNFGKQYPAANINVTLKYTQLKGQWRATPVVACGLKLKAVGGKSYVVKKGDTLWDIAKAHYGAGGLWTEIADVNKNNVTSKGDFILAGVTLKIPKLSVPIAECGVAIVSPKTSAPKDAIKTAKNVCVPPYTLDLNLVKPTVTIIKGPIVAWKISVKLTGTLLAVCDLLMDSGATIKSTAIAVERDAMGFVAGIQVNSVGEYEIMMGAKVGGTTWGIKIKPSKPGVLTGFTSGKNVKFKSGRTVFSGKIGIDITIQAMPRVRVQDIKGQLHEFWIDHGELIKDVALVGAKVVVGLAVVATVLSPVPGDEVIAFGAAMRLFPNGMKVLKYAH